MVRQTAATQQRPQQFLQQQAPAPEKKPTLTPAPPAEPPHREPLPTAAELQRKMLGAEMSAKILAKENADVEELNSGLAHDDTQASKELDEGPSNTLSSGVQRATDAANMCPTCTAFKPSSSNFFGLENVASAQAGGIPFASGSKPHHCERPGPGEGTGFGGKGNRCFQNINDAKVGTDSSWQPGSLDYNANRFVGIRFSCLKWITGFAVSSPQLPAQSKDALASTNSTYVIQVSTSRKVNHMTSSSLWRTLGSFTRDKPGVLYFTINTTKPLLATAIRIVVSEPLATIDEFEAYGSDGIRVAQPEISQMYSNVASRAQGGTPFASGSREGFCAKIEAGEGEDFCGAGDSCFCSVNDGEFADAGAWVPNLRPNSNTNIGKRKFVGIRFDDRKWIFGLRVSSQGNSSSLCCSNRFSGNFDIQVTSVADPSFDTSNDDWSIAGKFSMLHPGLHFFKFGWPISTTITALRFLVSSANAAIDEIEVYGGDPLIRLLGAPPSNTFPGNIAAGSVPFGSGSSAAGCSDALSGDGNISGPNCFSRINDGSHSNDSAWIPGSNKVDNQTFAGFRFDQAYSLVGFSLSGPGAPQPTPDNCFQGDYLVETTTDASQATGDTLGNSWTAIGSFSRSHSGETLEMDEMGERDKTKVYTKHYYKFIAPVIARGFRVVVSAADMMCVGEIEVYGDLYIPDRVFYTVL